MYGHSFENPDLEQNRVELMRILQDFQSRFDVWGHGVTSPEIANQIVTEGLRTDWKAIHDIAHKLPEHGELSTDKIRHWDYESRKFIVLIAVRKGLTSTDVGGYEIREKAIRASQEHVFTKSEKRKNVVTPAKIIGYVDANTFKFVANPNFSDRVS